jgi:hypothetical protein
MGAAPGALADVERGLRLSSSFMEVEDWLASSSLWRLGRAVGTSMGRYHTEGLALATTDALVDGQRWLLVQYLEVRLSKPFAGSASALAAPDRALGNDIGHSIHAP